VGRCIGTDPAAPGSQPREGPWNGPGVQEAVDATRQAPPRNRHREACARRGRRSKVPHRAWLSARSRRARVQRTLIVNLPGAPRRGRFEKRTGPGCAWNPTLLDKPVDPIREGRHKITRTTHPNPHRCPGTEFLITTGTTWSTAVRINRQGE